MNVHQKRRFRNKNSTNIIQYSFWKKIAFLGWAFKKKTNDIGESTAIYIANDLLEEQANISVYDPKVTSNQIQSDLNYLKSRSDLENRNGLTYINNPYEVCKDAHAIVLLTEWNEFITYDWQKICNEMQKPAFVFDGRNVLDKKVMETIGFVYQAIGL